MSWKLNRSLTIKIALVLIVASSAVYFAWTISRSTLDSIKTPMNRLSIPDSHLIGTQQLFNDVVRLDQLQRLYTLQPHASTQKVITTLQQRIQSNLAQLRTNSGADSLRIHALDTLEQLIHEHDQLFRTYVKQRRLYLTQDTLNVQIQTLVDHISEQDGLLDTNLIATQKHSTEVIKVYDLETPKEKISLFSRLFGSKKSPPKTAVQRIQREVHIQIDTVKLQPDDSLLAELSHSIAEGEAQRQSRLQELLFQRQAMSLASNRLFTSLLTRIQELDRDGQLRKQESNREAMVLIEDGLGKINALLLLFLIIIVLLVLFITLDIYRINRYKEELVWARDEAESQSQARHRLLANISHEIRSPLQVIVGYAEQLNAVKPAKSKTSKGIDLIHRSSRHLLHVINEVLDYSRITSGKVRLNPSSFSPYDSLLEVVNIMKIKAEEKGLVLICVENPELQQSYWGDAFRFKQILFNLIDNAIKYTSRGFVRVNMKKLEDHAGQGSHLDIEVCDTGIGMEASIMETLFEPFQTKDPANIQGTGLGLAITRELIELQGGSIHFDSQPQKGTTVQFRLYYPFAIPQKNIHNSAIAPAAYEEVWVAEDDPVIRGLIQTILKKQGIPLYLFADGAEMLEKKIPNRPLAVFLDIRMPNMDGFELAAALRNKLKHHSHPVKLIALTAQLLSEMQEHPDTHLFDSILTKPFDEQDLLKSIHRQRRPERKERYGFEHSEEIWWAFKEESLTDIEALSTALKSVDQQGIISNIHRLAGRMGQIGWNSEHKNLRKLELRIKSPQNDNMQTILLDLSLLLEEIRKRLKEI